MAIWIDNNAYSDNCDEYTMYQYIYHLANMLAHESRYFIHNPDYYDDFSLYAANYVFLRYKNPKQFEYNENGEPKIKQIKSVLNYLRGSLYPIKVLFEQESYAQTTPKDVKTDEIIQDYNFRNKLRESTDELFNIDTLLYFNDLPKTIRRYFDSIPKKKNSSEHQNIYISCLLSFLNLITLDSKQLDSLKDKKVYDRSKELEDAYRKNRENFVILYHLPKTYYNYVWVLTIKLKHIISSDLTYQGHQYMPSDATSMTLLLGTEEDSNEY